ncbi:lipid-A-disaccharide synthase [Legionella dresdenensis]|uniref:Lipid-A-disaccharide synthase n=1 Tax=Legionella dresdenensis TaxID=450200 RepID=A0ABV8CE22_9GAMM
MQQPKRIVIIAGEESGDVHAANLVRELRANDNSLQISGIGGRHMEAAGVELISDLARYGVTGLTEVLKHLRVIRQAFAKIKTHLQNVKPDLLILVDYPGFNLRLAKYAKQELGLQILYYIGPQIWAWKAGRINTIRECVDQMAVILPFEKAIYEQAGVSAQFVGHPLLGKLPAHENILQLKQQLNLPTDKKIVAILPGSRRNEIEMHLPVMIQAAQLLQQKQQDVHFVLPIAGTLNPDSVKQFFKGSDITISFLNNQAMDAVSCSDCVIVASGTASLECALLQKPMCIIYKASLITYIAAMKVIRVKYLGLCNLLQNEMIVPELLQYDCNPHELSLMMENLLNNQTMIGNMTANLAKLKHSLSMEQADSSLAQIVLEKLNVGLYSPYPSS